MVDNTRYRIFVINLDRSRNRLAHMTNMLNNLHISFERIAACDGANLSESEMQYYYSKKKNYFRTSRYLRKSEIACYISHIKCWERIVKEGLDFAIIMEDDIELDEKIVSTIQFLKNYKFDIGYLQLGSVNWKHHEFDSISEDYGDYKIVRYKRFSGNNQIYAMSLRAATEMIKNAIPFGRTVDGDAVFFWQTGVLRRGLIPYSYTYKSELFDSQIDSKNELRYESKRRNSIITKSFIQDPYIFFMRLFFSICRKLNVKLKWEWWC